MCAGNTERALRSAHITAAAEIVHSAKQTNRVFMRLLVIDLPPRQDK